MTPVTWVQVFLSNANNFQIGTIMGQIDLTDTTTNTLGKSIPESNSNKRVSSHSLKFQNRSVTTEFNSVTESGHTFGLVSPLCKGMQLM